MLSVELLRLLDITPLDKHLGTTRKYLYEDVRFKLTKEQFSHNILKDEKWSVKALLLVNKIGFIQTDAEFGSGLAKHYEDNSYLTKGQLYYLKRLLVRYVDTLWEVIKEDC